MERNANESFAAYKVRRAAANLAVKNINKLARSGGSESSRAIQRRAARANDENNFSVGIRGYAASNRSPMGAGIAARAANRRVTQARLNAHMKHIAHVSNRKAKRAAANDSKLVRAA